MSTCLSQVALLVVTSTVLSSIGYCQSSRSLVLVFHSGSAHGYFDVPPEVFLALRAADSKGTFFNRSIRGVFRHAAIVPCRMMVSACACPEHSGVAVSRSASPRAMSRQTLGGRGDGR